MKTLFLSFLLFFSLIASAQKLELRSATAQSWYGGVAGHHGTNYTIIVTCTDTTIAPDTLWIGTTIYSKISAIESNTTIRKYDKKAGIVSYTLTAEEHYSDLQHKYAFSGQQPNNKGNQHLRHYDGAALVSYRYKGKQYSLIIKSMKVLSALCYP